MLFKFEEVFEEEQEGGKEEVCYDRYPVVGEAKDKLIICCEGLQYGEQQHNN